MFRKLSAFYFLALCLLTSCKVTYTVRESGQYLSHQYHLPCGVMEAKLRGRGNRDFMLVQKLSASGPMLLDPAGLEILLNHQPVKYHLSYAQSGKPLKPEKPQAMDDEQEILASFTLGNGVYNGDTIVVHFADYLHCGAKPMGMDDLVFYFAHGGINFR